ncbi:hypothetical protein [Bacteroides sp.]|uniref:hypothetical protein n=1 Tax=Bacteroides sp. TaxID=29523 RepID=UPI003A946FDC
MRIVIVALLLFFSSGVLSTPVIILKLDDVSVKDGRCTCLPIFEFLQEKRIHASFGVIAVRCDSTFYEVLSPYLNEKDSEDVNLFELWHHGYDHIKPEFRGTPYEYQKYHFEKADSIIEGFSGINLETFGAPFNQVDSITGQIFSESEGYKYVFFADKKLFPAENVVCLNNRVNIENGTGKIDFDFFVRNYYMNKDKYVDYMVLQGHPNLWKKEELNDFARIITFLLKEGCSFATPSLYCRLRK